MVDATNFLRFDLSASLFRLGAMSLHCDNAQLLEFASSTNPYGLTFAELLALSALAQRAMAQRELAQGAWPKGMGLAQCRIALEGGDGLPAWKKYGDFRVARRLRCFIEASNGRAPMAFDLSRWPSQWHRSKFCLKMAS